MNDRDIPTAVLAGVAASEVSLRAIPPLSGVVVLTWYEPEPNSYNKAQGPRWTAPGPFADEAKAREWLEGCNRRHLAALIVPVEWGASK